MSTALLALLLLAQPDAIVAAPDTAVVCPEIFRDALGPWIDYRRGQGHGIAVLSNQGSQDDIRRQIRDVARGGRLRFVVLVGSADPDLYWNPAVRARCVPMHYAKARVNVHWGSEPTLSTDNWYVQPEEASDESPRPQWAIGRLAADTPDELRQMVAKILAYERSTDFGPWRRKMNFVASAGGFGSFADNLLESAARHFLTESIPAEYHVSMTYASWQSPYCPDPRQFHATAIERLSEGSLFWVYLGHGYHLGLEHVHVPGGHYPILDVPDAATLRASQGRPIAVFLSCYAGAIDARRDCLAKALLRSPGGPVAVLAATRVTMPYAMTLMATNLTDQCFNKHCETLGAAVLHAKQDMLKEPVQGDQQRAMLDMMARVISPGADQLAAERAEHVLMFNLLGDPLLRLRHPKRVELRIPPTVTAGETVEVSGTCPFDGQATLEMVLRRDRLRFARPDRREYPRTAEELARFQEVYSQANDQRLRTVAIEIRNGRFTARLDVPPDARGPCHVCVFVEGTEDFAIGAADVDARKVPIAFSARRQVK